MTDVLQAGAARFSPESWEALFRPGSIALVGASPNSSFHARVVRNAGVLGYGGRLLPVNPSRSEVFGLPCAPSVSAIGESVDMVAISGRGARVVDVILAALDAGARSLVMYTAGLGEADAAGRERQARIVERCLDARVTLLGPNGLGLLNPHSGAPTFGADVSALAAGGIGLVAQSGSAALALLASGRDLGFSIAASSGNEAVVTVEDLVEVLIEDEATTVIALFLEGLRDGRRFRELMARADAAGKPVVALTVGASAAGKTIVATHTGRLAGDARIMRAALRDLGVMVVSDFDEMVETMYLLSRPAARAVGRRLGVLALSGGELSMATDAAYAVGLETPAIGAPTAARIAAELELPSHVVVGNPLDLAGVPGADGDGMLEKRYAAAAAGMLTDRRIDTVLVVQDAPHTLPATLVDWYLGAARGAVAAQAQSAKPLLAISPLSSDITPRLRDCFEKAGVPVLRGLRPGLRALSAVAHRRTPEGQLPDAVDPELVRWAGRLAEGNREPDERDVKELLAAAGVAVVEDRLCRSAEEAVATAEDFGYPVVLKVVSPDILHKSDIGGVRLNLGSADEVRDAFELILRNAAAAEPHADIRGILVAPQVPAGCELVVGGLVDPTFGPMVMVGLGGVFVEVLQDVAFALAPTSEAAALAMLRQLRGRRALEAFRGRSAVDQQRVAQVVSRVSALMAAGDGLVESIEINPLVADDRGALALDARVVLRDRAAVSAGVARGVRHSSESMSDKETDQCSE
jgi:acyl-CoA synthetase (NDP forming)